MLLRDMSLKAAEVLEVEVLHPFIAKAGGIPGSGRFSALGLRGVDGLGYGQGFRVLLCPAVGFVQIGEIPGLRQQLPQLSEAQHVEGLALLGL